MERGSLLHLHASSWRRNVEEDDFPCSLFDDEKNEKGRPRRLWTGLGSPTETRSAASRDPSGPSCAAAELWTFAAAKRRHRAVVDRYYYCDNGGGCCCGVHTVAVPADDPAAVHSGGLHYHPSSVRCQTKQSHRMQGALQPKNERWVEEQVETLSMLRYDDEADRQQTPNRDSHFDPAVVAAAAVDASSSWKPAAAAAAVTSTQQSETWVEAARSQADRGTSLAAAHRRESATAWTPDGTVRTWWCTWSAVCAPAAIVLVWRQ